nr:MAG TPA: hypothetical protein [Caudoviricetes sp.]
MRGLLCELNYVAKPYYCKIVKYYDNFIGWNLR